MRTIFLISLLIVTLVSCSSYSELSTTTTIPTKTKTPSLTPKLTTSATLSVNATPSSTPDFATQILFSPNSKFVAKQYDVYSRPSLEKSVIEILDEQGMLLWQIPYQGEMPRGDPHQSLSIYKWANDNSALYFYYSFQYDGYHTLSNGFNLQKVVINTGEIEKVVPGTELMAFAFSPDENDIAYARNQDTQRKLVIRNLSTKSEKSIDIDIASESFIQVGWISWSPNGEKVLYHVETGEQVWAFYLDTKAMKQKEILRFWLEEYWFDGWTQDEKPRYIDLHSNISVIDVETGNISAIGIATQTPSVNQ